MKDVSKHLGPRAAATNAPRLPAAVDRATWQAELDTLRVRSTPPMMPFYDDASGSSPGRTISAFRAKVTFLSRTW
jgi:hypothetical protein